MKKQTFGGPLFLISYIIQYILIPALEQITSLFLSSLRNLNRHIRLSAVLLKAFGGEREKVYSIVIHECEQIYKTKSLKRKMIPN